MKKILSIITTIAIFCTFGINAVYAAQGEGDYFYFDIEHIINSADSEDEDNIWELYMQPVKIYTNGFYGYAEAFCEFDSPIDNAADGIENVLNYYKDNEEPLNENGVLLNDFTNSGGFFTDFKFTDSNGEKKEFPYPSTSYNNVMSNGLGSYTFSSGELNCGDTIRMLFWDYSAGWDSKYFTSPASDGIIKAIGDYYELASENPSAVNKNITAAYEAALQGFFTDSDTLAADLNNAMQSSSQPSGKCELKITQNNIAANGSAVVSIENGTETVYNNAAIIFAAYDKDNKLVWAKLQNKTIGSGSVTAQFSGLESSDSIVTVKAFAWDMTSLKAVTGSASN